MRRFMTHAKKTPSDFFFKTRKNRDFGQVLLDTVQCGHNHDFKWLSLAV